MKLADKGRFAPPPKLRPAAQRVAAAVTSWENIEARTHWLLGDENEVDGADFYCGDEEVGHIHLGSEAHIFLPRSVADTLIEAKLARPMPWSRSAVLFEVSTPGDVNHAIWLFRLSYERRRGSSTTALLERVRDGLPGRTSMDATVRRRPSRRPAASE